MKIHLPFFLVAVILVIGYLDSPLFSQKEDFVTSLPLPVEESTSANAQENKQVESFLELESKFVELREEDGYTVEVYQEFEVYKDKEGNLVESIPTTNYHYLRYKK
ncbi:hypothetical protein [Metabacillus litoralis]|uniref:hypothetical protein n=1 Tax=Metabacillus litoralis TaxID=152268 RepID=UPI001CFD77BC|nr:hypothetical protein [Metabacillus litoralis]